MIAIHSLMNPSPVTIGESDDLQSVGRLMRDRRVRHLPVVRGAKLVGLISHRDFIRAIEAERHRSMGEPYWAADIMTRHVITVDPETPVREAVTLMIEHKIGCLPVVHGHRLVGLVTETDLLRLCQKLLNELDARESGEFRAP